MLQVPVPIDLGTIAMTQSSAFALATPMRVRELLELAVALALGRRSPDDRRARGLQTTLAGLERGEFVVEIDGRIYQDASALVMCSGQVSLRFFAHRHAPQTLQPAE